MKAYDNLQSSKNNAPANRLTQALFVIYLVILCWILLFKLGVRFSYMQNRRFNLIPFGGAFSNAEAIMNIIVFVPLGIYAGMLFSKRSFGRQVFSFFLLSLIIEGLQFIFRIGTFDVTDMVTNTLGATTGLLLWIAVEKIFNYRIKAQWWLNLFAATGTFIIVLLLVLLKLKMLPIRYQ